jgi:hypothetical protein
MKSAVAAIAAVVACLVVANMLGVASAEAPTGTSPRTVGVGGIAIVPVAQGSSAAAATAVYRQAMAAAVSDGQSKAEFLASKAGATLGSVQSIVEGGGYIGCTSEESGYAEYQGEQPDFGSPAGSVSVARAGSGVAAAPPATPVVRKPGVKHRKKKLPAAKKATATGCTLTAQVSVVYIIT